ncbi:SDR family NAD(P)-dependent oxidoreductase [Paenibacillus monticola]|nr:SDR family NAD(P)-dependent oxidoreductase [Paenibacillus monticola]
MVKTKLKPKGTYEVAPASTDNGPYELIVLTAKTATALQQKIIDLEQWLEQQSEPEIDLVNVAYTLLVGRSHFPYRKAAVVKSLDELRQILRADISAEFHDGEWLQGGPGSEYGKGQSSASLERMAEIIRGIRLVPAKVRIKSHYLELAQMFVAGISGNLETLYAGQGCRKLSLPAYPFAQDRYWVPDSPAETGSAAGSGAVRSKDNTHRAEALHPLIDSNCSTVTALGFHKTFYPHEFFLADHLVEGEGVLPGVAYLEMARVAGTLANPGAVVNKLTDIIWLQPFRIAKGEQQKEATLQLLPATDRLGAFQYEMSTTHQEGLRIVNGKGIIHYAAAVGTQKPQHIDVDLIRSRCNVTMNKETCYAAFRQRGLQLGRSFQALTELRHNDTETLAYLELPDLLEEQFSHYLLHPSLMDGALEAVIGLVHSGDGRVLSLPFAIDEIEIHAPLPKVCLAYVTNSEIQQDDRYSRKFDVQLTDKDGRVLVSVTGFTLKVMTPAQALDDVNEVLYYNPAWELAPLQQTDAEPVTTTTSASGARSVTVVFNDEVLYRSLAGTEAFLTGKQVVFIEHGDYKERADGGYSLHYAQRDDFHRMLLTLKQNHKFPGEILFVGSQSARTAAAHDVDDFTDELRTSLQPVLLLLQALIDMKLETQTQVLYLCPAFEHPSAYSAVHTALSALGKTVQLENSRLQFRIIEGQKDLPDKQKLALVQQELGEKNRDAAHIRYIDGIRECLRLRESPVKLQASGGLTVRKNGTYLITGGAGGLGLIFAEHFAEQASPTLILTGRSPLTESQQNKIKAIRAKGATVEYRRADVTVREDVQSLMAYIQNQGYSLTGVVHAAGITSDGYLANKAAADFWKVIEPKTAGTVFLDEATKDLSLEFFVLFSSIAAVNGNAGQADYAYANCYMDHFTKVREYWRQQGIRSGKTLSINWPLWAEGGVRMEESTLALYSRTAGVIPLDTLKGIEAFERGLSLVESSQFGIVQGDARKLRLLLELDPAPLSSGQHIQHSTVRLNDDELTDALNGNLIAIVSALTKVKARDIFLHKALSEYGFHSINLAEFADRINEQYELRINPSIFFEYATLEALARFLLNDHKDAVTARHTELLATRIDKSLDKPFMAAEPAAPRKPIAAPGKSQVREEDVAIIGVAGLMPQSEDLDQFWEHLSSQRDLVTEIPPERWDWRDFYSETNEPNTSSSKWGGFLKEVDTFDAAWFGISPAEAELMDPQQRLFLQTVWSTIEDAGYKASALSGSRTGVFVGVGTMDYYDVLLANGIEIEPHFSTGNSHSVLANRISYLLNFHGPSEPVNTACSSSLVAIHRAVQSIRSGESELAIAGGVNVIASPLLYLAFGKSGMLSKDGKCRTFDHKANGYVRGEGAGAILLKPLSKAIEDRDHIYGVVKGSAVNHGGRANSLTAPNVNAQVDLLVEAYSKADVSPGTVTYIEAHGTGTPLGDPAEINGLKKAFSTLGKLRGEAVPLASYCCIGSVKTNIGHLETAAGIAGVIKVLLAMKNGSIPGNVHFEGLNPYIELEGSPFYIADTTQPWAKLTDARGNTIPRRAGISSFGFGGANAHVILEQYEAEDSIPDVHNVQRTDGEPQVVILSAKSKEQLKEYSRKLVSFLSRQNHDSAKPLLADLAFTLQTGREESEERLAVVTDNLNNLQALLSLYCSGTEQADGLFAGTAEAHRGVGVPESVTWRQDGQPDLYQLARSWVQGALIPWADLQGGIPQRLSLPTYPYAKERHWVGNKNTFPMFKPNVSVQPMLHPLIGQNTSSLYEQKFSSRLSGEEFFFKDHVIGGTQILPGAAYLEMARAAGQIAGEQRVSKLRNFVWLQPLTTTGETCEITTILVPKGAFVEAQIRSAHDQGIIYAQGNIILAESQPEADSQENRPKLNISAIIERCDPAVTSEACYWDLSGMGFQYGPSLRVIQQHGSRSNKEAWAYLSLPAGITDTLHSYELHPSLVDGTLQSALLMGTLGARDSKFLPFALDELEWISPLVQECFCHIVSVEDASERTSALRKYNLAIADRSGNLLVRMNGFSSRLVQTTLPVTKAVEDEVLDMLYKLQRGDIDLNEAERIAEGSVL